MNTIKRLTIVTFILSFATASHAKPKAKSPPRITHSKAKVSTEVAPTRTKVPKTKDYDFLADEVDGQRLAPTGDSIYGVDQVQHATLIRFRSHFIREIVASAYAL